MGEAQDKLRDAARSELRSALIVLGWCLLAGLLSWFGFRTAVALPGNWSMLAVVPYFGALWCLLRASKHVDGGESHG